MSEKDSYLQVKEASKILGVNPETLRRWDNTGKLKAK
ncbi:MerR family DNA-binding transcriptional regulator [Thermoproteota archaeon]